MLYFEMNSISWFIFFIAISCSFHILEAFETGLVISRKFERLDEISADDIEKECDSCMVACPAFYGPEVLINKHASVTQNSVFTQRYYPRKITGINVAENRCEKPFSGPMIVYDEKNDTYEVGYELYSEEGQFKNDMECKKFDNFKKTTEDYTRNLKELDITKDTLEKDSITKVGYNDVHIKVDIGTKFKYRDERSFAFFWISVLSFRFHPPKNQISVYLNADIVNDYNTNMKCDNYELGNDLYTSEKNFYPFSKEIRGSIVKTSLVPLQYLHTKAAKLAGCTELNSIPVWYNVARRLNLIDQSLYALYQEKDINPKINMFFGVSGNIETKKVSNNDGSDNKDIDQTEESVLVEKENELQDEKDIIMPNILYRVVEYADVTIGDNGIKPVMNKLLVIIIHNEPNGVTNKDRLCGVTEVTDIKVLWNEKIEKEKEILSYACAPDYELLKKLGVHDEPSTKSYSTLSIKEQFRLEFTDDVKEPIVKIKRAQKKKIQGENQPQ